MRVARLAYISGSPFSAPGCLFGARNSERSRSQERSGEPECIVGGPGEIPVSARERTRRVESRLGEPTKQNAGERGARLGPWAVQAKQCPTDPVSRH